MRARDLALELEESAERDHRVPWGPHTSRKAKGNRNYEMTRQKTTRKQK